MITDAGLTLVKTRWWDILSIPTICNVFICYIGTNILIGILQIILQTLVKWDWLPSFTSQFE